MASREKLYKKGNKLIILTESYVNYFNDFISNMDGKIKKRKYAMDKAFDEIKNGKETRPVIIFWSNENHDMALAFSTTTSKSNYNINNSFKVKNVYWQAECLIVNKNKTYLVESSISEKISFEDIDNFMNFLNDNYNHTYEFIKNKIQKFELEAEINRLKKELEKNN